MSKAQQFHDMTTAELRGKYDDLKQELFNLRFQQTTGQLKNPLSLRTVKKDIARVMTVLREREGDLYKNPGKKAVVTSKTKEVKK